MQSDLAVAEMTKATEALKLEVADTIASLSQMALSGAPSAGEDGEFRTLCPCGGSCRLATTLHAMHRASFCAVAG
jgi:hypothetical protein